MPQILVNSMVMLCKLNQNILLNKPKKEEITEREQIMAKKINLVIHGMQENKQDLHDVKQMINVKHMVEQYYNDNCYLMGTHEVNQYQVAMLISKLSKT